MSPSYQQGDDLFVTSDTFFSLSSNVSVPYFEYLYYRINGGDWIEYLDAFSISGLDGVYTIDFYGIDFVGAVEEIKSITVNLVSLEIDSYFTECENGYFDVIFRKSKEGGFELVTTNPGVFIYRAEILNSWPALIDNLTYAFTLPADFIFSGTNPIHICLDGVDITPLCIIDGTNVIIFNIPSGALITVELHLKYALRGCLFPSLEEFTMKGYQFLNSITAFGGHPSVAGDGLLGSYSSIDILVAHQKKVTALAGFIYSSDGAPIFNALIELYDANNQLVTTTYSDESGFFYFLDLEAGVYSLQVVFQDQIDLTTVTAIKNEVVIVEVFLE